MMMCLGYLDTGWKACAGGELGEEAQSEDGGGLLQHIGRIAARQEPARWRRRAETWPGWTVASSTRKENRSEKETE